MLLLLRNVKIGQTHWQTIVQCCMRDGSPEKTYAEGAVVAVALGDLVVDAKGADFIHTTENSSVSPPQGRV